jgi:hypothetical protein
LTADHIIAVVSICASRTLVARIWAVHSIRIFTIVPRFAFQWSGFLTSVLRFIDSIHQRTSGARVSSSRPVCVIPTLSTGISIHPR